MHDDGVVVSPVIFAPGTEWNEFVQIQFRFDQAGWVANVAVFDQAGRLLRTIASNEIIGPEGFFRWDGERDDGSRVRSGYYVIKFEIFRDDGSVKSFLKRVIAASR